MKSFHPISPGSGNGVGSELETETEGETERERVRFTLRAMNFTFLDKKLGGHGEVAGKNRFL